MKKPITQRAKSPLKQTNEAVDLNKETTTTSTGEDIVSESVVKKPGKVIGGGSPRKMSNEAWLKFLENETEEEREARHQREVERGWREPATEEVITTVTPGETTTTTETEKAAPVMRDKYTGITPWENRFNMRTARQSERFARREAKRDLRRQANEDARRARRQGGMSYADSLKLRNSIMKGDDPKYAEMYNASRGITPQAQKLYDTQMQQNQFEQGSTRGENVNSNWRKVGIGDVGEGPGNMNINNVKAQDPDYKADFSTEKTVKTETKDNSNSPAAMRYDQNVGIKHRTPMKKGYFKGK
jgi:hypothetical protein